MTAGPLARIRPMRGGVLAVAFLAAAATHAEGSVRFDPRILAAADSIRVASLGSVEAALDTLDEARWGFVAAMHDGSLDRLRRTSDARERASETLSRMLSEVTGGER